MDNSNNIATDVSIDRARVGFFASLEISEIFTLLLSGDIDDEDCYLQLKRTLLDRGHTLIGVVMSAFTNDNYKIEEMRQVVNWDVFHKQKTV